MVYEGMIVGSHRRDGDIEINVCKEKKLTNMRSSTADVAKRLNATIQMSLEESLEFIADDELVGGHSPEPAPAKDGPLGLGPKAQTAGRSPRQGLGPPLRVRLVASNTPVVAGPTVAHFPGF